MSGYGAPTGGKLSHAYIIASQDTSAREKKALELACALVCAASSETPCMSCRQCKTALNGVNPDVIVLGRKTDDKGKQKREIQVEQIRNMSSDAWVRPQFADRKVYIIEDAGSMNVAAQNAALKLLEEPPEYAAFILCADSAEAMLLTIRSRCVTIRIAAQADRAENPLAEEYIKLAGKADKAGICTFFSRCENMDSEQTADFVDAVRMILCDHIGMRRKTSGIERSDAVLLLDRFETAREYLKMNVGTKHVLGMLCVSTAQQ